MKTRTLRQTLSAPDSLAEHVLEINLGSPIAKPRAVTFTQSDGKTAKRFAIVTTARQEQTTVDATRCVLEMHSWPHMLQDVPSCAVYQNMTAVEITQKAAKEQGFVDIKNALAKTAPKREYTVQYNESTLDFISRILAEDGIFYYFEHNGEKHTMVLADGESGLSKLPDMHWRAMNPPETPDACVWDLRPEKHAVTASVKVDDYNCLTPSTSLAASKGSGTPQFRMNGTRHSTQQDGESVAARRLASLKTMQTVLRGKTAAPEMAVGGIFKITGCPDKSLNASWAVVAFDMIIDENGAVDASFTAVPPAAVAAPVPARPRIAGPMTGVVCGAAGEKIRTDEHGRIKVRLHWNREGKPDDSASCWLRVVQPWAGADCGAVFLPRVGQEVLVDFLGGDPDRPVVTGCLYNAANKPPWKLPDNAAATGVKDTKNTLSMDDTKDKERVFLHAGKLLEVLADDERRVTVAGDGGDTLTLDKGSREVSVKKGDDKLTVKGKRTVKIDGDCEIIVGGSLTLKADGKVILQSGKNAVAIESKTALSLAAGTDLSAKAKTGLALEAGTALSGKGKTGASLDGGAQLDLKAAMFTIKGSGTGAVDGGGMLTVKGGMVRIN